MDDRAQLKQAETKYLASEYKNDPEAFKMRAFVEDSEVLGEFGIYIPGKDTSSTGLLKLWPEDFLVEERLENGSATVLAGEPPLSSEGETVYATLVKCGISTIEAVQDIARALSLRIEDVMYAGIKDKDAITAQAISIRNSTLLKVASLRTPHFFLKDARTGKGVMEKGKLKGNRFTIVVRTEKEFFGEESVNVFVEKLKVIEEYGFYNFFYLQRFGTPRLNNFAWARMILRGEYEKAVKDIITFEGRRELQFFKHLRQTLGTNFGAWDEMHKIMEPLPLSFSHEIKMVEYLSKHPGDYAGALATIPEQITLWMYALSSLMFNQYISNCLLRDEEPPEELPFFLSHDKAVQNVYRDMLQGLGIYPPPFENLKRFPQIQIKTRFIKTKDRCDIRRSQVIDEGVVIEFDLGKGQYATTFLSHLFNLTAGAIPENFPKNRVDSKALIGEASLMPVVEQFAPVIREKGNNIFEEMAE